MNPYPFALLNHLTVPFIRSTCSPSFCDPLARWGEFQGPQNYAGIVRLKEGTVKATAYKTRGFWLIFWCRSGYHLVIQCLFRACNASHRTPAIVLASRIRP